MNLRKLASLCAISVAAAGAKADTFTPNPNAADNTVIRSGSGTLTLGDDSYAGRVGEYYAPGGICYVAPFQIPTLPTGQVFSDATLRFQLYDKGANEANADLYAVRINASPTVLTSDYYQGSNPDPNATLLQQGILTSTTSVRVDGNTGFVTSSGSTGFSLAAFLNRADINNSLAGSYVFLRITYAVDPIPDGNNFYTVLTENAGGDNEKPLLTLTSATIPEPSTLALAALGAGGLFVMVFRRRKAA